MLLIGRCPTFSRMGFVMVFALMADVVDDRIEIGWADRFGPIPFLPSEVASKAAVMVQLVRRCALQVSHEFAERSRRGETDDDVNVVACAACSENQASQREGFLAQHGDETTLERGGKHPAPSRRGPDDVDDEQGGRTTRHGDFSAVVSNSCSRTTPSEVARGRDVVET